MSKEYTATKLENVMMRIVFFDSKDVDHEDPEFYAARLDTFAKLEDDDKNDLGRIINQTYLGQAKAQKWTKKEIYDYLNNLCAPLAAKLKKLYEDGIDVDPSQ